MAIGLEVDERVFVPLSVLENAPERASAFLETKVYEVESRSVRIAVQDDFEWVAASKCQRNIGLLILSIGDLLSEPTLLDPLSNSVTQFCRLLASDDYVRSYKVRSKSELGVIWAREHAAHSHVIIVGHGNRDGLNFAVDGWQTADQLAEIIDLPDAAPKYFVSLSCEAGHAAFGRPFSRMHTCEAFVGPFQSVHGAVASQFVQSFLVYHLLHGETSTIAFRHSRKHAPGSTSFRLWRRGRLTADH